MRLSAPRLVWRAAWCAVLCAGLATTASTAHAQDDGDGRPIELGIDAGINITLGSNAVTTVSVPAQRFRVGFYLSDVISIEPSMSLNYTHYKDGSAKAFSGEIGVIFNTAAVENDNRFYLRPFGGYEHIGITSGTSKTGNTQPYAGAGAGVRMPIVDRLQARIEANYAHVFDSKSDTDTARNVVGLLAGFSFLTK